MADPNESHRDPRAQDPEQPPEQSRPPEVVDAEVVEDPTPAKDDAEFRQYQQFLEFQKFQEWQRSQSGASADLAVPTPSAPTQTTTTPPQPVEWPDAPQGNQPVKWPTPTSSHRGTVWFKRLLWPLRFKLVRRLIYLIIILIIAYNMFTSVVTDLFGGGSDDNGGGGTGGAPPDSTPINSTNPVDGVNAVYNYLRQNPPSQMCDLFDAKAKAAFAKEHQAPDCYTAAVQLHAQITSPSAYASPGFAPNAVEQIGDQATVYGCRMQVSGGPKLGSFRFTRQQGKDFIISGYDLNPPACGG